MQQPGAVAAVDLQHRVSVGGAVIDHHARRHMNGAHPAAQQGAGRAWDFRAEPQMSGQRLFDQHVELGQAVRLVERAAGGVLHPERVQRHAVGQRMDARVHDRGAGDRERARDAAEQAGMVGGVDGHFRHRAGRQRLGFHRQRRVRAPRHRGSAGRGAHACRDRTTASSRHSRGRGDNALYPPAPITSSNASAAALARLTRTSRSVVESPPASTSATRAYISRSSVAFQPFHTFGETARMSATVSTCSSFSRSGDCIVRRGRGWFWGRRYRA